MFLKIPYDVYQEQFKGSLFRLKWNKDMKMFEVIDEKEHDMPEDLLKYKVNFIVVDYDKRDIAKDLGALFCGHRKQWYYIGDEVSKHIQFTKYFKTA